MSAEKVKDCCQIQPCVSRDCNISIVIFGLAERSPHPSKGICP